MLDFIVGQFKSSMIKRIKKTAKQNGWEEKDVYVFLALDEQGENSYFMCHKGVPKMKVDFMYMIDAKVDFMQKGQIVPPFIKNALVRLSETDKIDPKQVGVMIVKKDDSTIRMCLYSGFTFVRDVTTEEIFQTEEN